MIQNNATKLPQQRAWYCPVLIEQKLEVKIPDVGSRTVVITWVVTAGLLGCCMNSRAYYYCDPSSWSCTPVPCMFPSRKQVRDTEPFSLLL